MSILVSVFLSFQKVSCGNPPTQHLLEAAIVNIGTVKPHSNNNFVCYKRNSFNDRKSKE